MKKFICGLLCSVLVMSAIPTFAETTKSISAVFGRVNLVVNNEPVKQETLLYNGTTYVPLRAVSEILDKEVNYDNLTRTAYIDNQGSNRKTLLQNEKDALEKEYDDAINYVNDLITFCNDRDGFIDAGNYIQAKKVFYETITLCDEIINKYSSSSPQLETQMKNLAKTVKNAAIQGNLFMDAMIAADYESSYVLMDKHYDYLDEAVVIFGEMVSDSNVLFAN